MIDSMIKIILLLNLLVFLFTGCAATPEAKFLRKAKASSLEYVLTKTSPETLMSEVASQTTSLLNAYAGIKRKFGHMPEVASYTDLKSAAWKRIYDERMAILSEIEKVMSPDDTLFTYGLETEAGMEIGLIVLNSRGKIVWQRAE